MEEDVEIESLLNSEDGLLMEVSQLTREENNEGNEYEQHISENNCWSNQIESLKNKSVEIESNEDMLLNQQQLSITTTKKDANTGASHNDEVQELLDDQIVLYLAKRPTKHVLQLHSMSSDEEHERSENDSEDDRFINEISAENGLYRGVCMEHLNKIIKSKSKQIKNSAVSDLMAAHGLVVERDHLLKNLELKLQEKLYLVEKAIEHKQKIISLLSVDEHNNTKIPNLSRYFFKKFGMPYFKDRSGFGPLHNLDYVAKLRNDEAKLMLIEKPSYWIVPHQEKLLDAIRETLVAEKTDKLINQINKIKAKLEPCSSKGNNEVLIQQLVKYQEELSDLTSKSAEELISGENPNRDYDWMKYSLSLFDGEHSHDECKRFWDVYLKPTINKSKWSSAEDLKLLDIAEQLQFQDWDSIAKQLGTYRSAYQCFVHFQTRLNSLHEFSKGKWTKEEDEKLLGIINHSKIGDFIPWTKVSCHMGDRSHVQIYNRFRNSLNPKLIKGRFTRGEDLLIVAGIEVFGCSYNELSSLMNNRSACQIRERYERYLLPKNSRVGSFSLEEDEKLLRLVEKHGAQNWCAVSNEMKTRSRTQVRQRYRLIQRNMKLKPGWTINSIERRDVHLIDKSIGVTEKNVRIIKQEIGEVERAFNLTKLEKDTFRIEKLKELRDKVLLMKHNVRPKRKMIFTDGLRIKNRLIQYFKHSQIRPPKCTVIGDHDSYKSYLNEILLLAKNFGHELQIPEDENEIINNPRLSNHLKNVLLESENRNIGSSIQSKKEPHSIASGYLESSIDYIPPEIDNSIIMNEWWFNPPMDVRRLNFSEFFKRTVFDYSYGMHQDIWFSKMKRSLQINFSFSDKPPLIQSQPPIYNMPPNHLTSLGLKSVLLSRARLKNESKEETMEQFFGETEDITVKQEVDINKLLHQFQETMVTLFTWPRTLSLNSISSNSLIKSSSEKASHNRRKILNQNNVKCSNLSQDLWLQDLKTIERKKNAKDQKAKVRKSILVQHLDLKREGLDIKRGIKCKRKMKIEHFVKEEGEKKHFSDKNVHPKRRITRNLRCNDGKHLSDVNCDEPAKSKIKNQTFKVDRVISSNCIHEKESYKNAPGSNDEFKPIENLVELSTLRRSSLKTYASLQKRKRNSNSQSSHPSKKICGSSTQ